jgi:hypothetical protein
MLDISTLRNAPDPLFDPLLVVAILGKQPQPAGEVAAYAADIDIESVSVAANAPEVLAPEVIVPLVGEVIAGASFPGELPPSVLGTTYD